LSDIYERFCAETGIAREEPILYAGEKAKRVMAEYKQASDRAVCLFFHGNVIRNTNLSSGNKSRIYFLEEGDLR
jgi:hypothetical protein